MVSIVIPTLGRDSLQDLMLSLPKSTQLEVLAVADGGMDNDRFVKMAARWQGVVITQAKTTGVNSARNHGAALASHDVIWFLDDDVVVPNEQHILELLASHFENADLAAVGGAYLTPPNASIVEQGYNLLSSLWRHASGESDNEAFLGGCLAVRKAVFFELGGFDETIKLGGAETGFVHRLRNWSKSRGRVLRYEKRLDVFHRPGARRLDQWMKLAFRQGIQAVETDQLRPPTSVRMARTQDFVKRLSVKERIVLAAFCLPYLGVTGIGRAASTWLKSK
jgi:glycosyltransferase involved in cell wall biosynthesis